MFDAIHIIGTGRAGGAIRARLGERGLRVTDGRDSGPGGRARAPRAFRTQVIGEVAAGVPVGPWVAHVSGATHLAPSTRTSGASASIRSRR